MGSLPEWMSYLIPSWADLLVIPAVLIASTVHGVACSMVAYLLGDYSQVERGRLNLNPFRHVSWLSAVLFVFFRVGWARPIEVDPDRLKGKWLGLLIVSLSGVTATMLLFILSVVITSVMVSIVSIVTGSDPYTMMAALMMSEQGQPTTLSGWEVVFLVNLPVVSMVMTIVNSLPLPRMDGFLALYALFQMWRGRGEKEERGDEKAQTPTPAERHDPAQIHFEIGAGYHEEGKYEEAIARYRQAIAADSSFGPAYASMGRAYLAVGRRKQAIQAFRGATLYASDEESRSNGWKQLHALSEITSLDGFDVEEEIVEQSRRPWKESHPRLDWLVFGFTLFLGVAGIGCIYAYLLLELMLKFG